MPNGRPFTPETARIAALKGQQTLREAREARAARLLSAANGEEFLQDTLARTREALADTLSRLLAAKEPKDRELLARALSHLAETERKLAGRPLPGSRRPSASEPAAPKPALPVPR